MARWEELAVITAGLGISVVAALIVTHTVSCRGLLVGGSRTLNGGERKHRALVRTTALAAKGR